MLYTLPIEALGVGGRQIGPHMHAAAYGGSEVRDSGLQYARPKVLTAQHQQTLAELRGENHRIVILGQEAIAAAVVARYSEQYPNVWPKILDGLYAYHYHAEAENNDLEWSHPWEGTSPAEFWEEVRGQFDPQAQDVPGESVAAALDMTRTKKIAMPAGAAYFVDKRGTFNGLYVPTAWDALPVPHGFDAEQFPAAVAGRIMLDTFTDVDFNRYMYGQPDA